MTTLMTMGMVVGIMYPVYGMHNEDEYGKRFEDVELLTDGEAKAACDAFFEKFEKTGSCRLSECWEKFHKLCQSKISAEIDDLFDYELSKFNELFEEVFEDAANNMLDKYTSSEISEKTAESNLKDMAEKLNTGILLIPHEGITTFNKLASKEAEIFNKEHHPTAVKKTVKELSSLVRQRDGYQEAFTYITKSITDLTTKIIEPCLKHIPVYRNTIHQKFETSSHAGLILTDLTIAISTAQACCKLIKKMSLERPKNNISSGFAFFEGTSITGGFMTAGTILGSTILPGIGTAVGWGIGTGVGIGASLLDVSGLDSMCGKEYQIMSMLSAHNFAILFVSKAFELLNELQVQISTAYAEQIEIEQKNREQKYEAEQKAREQQERQQHEAEKKAWEQKFEEEKRMRQQQVETEKQARQTEQKRLQKELEEKERFSQQQIESERQTRIAKEKEWKEENRKLREQLASLEQQTKKDRERNKLLEKKGINEIRKMQILEQKVEQESKEKEDQKFIIQYLIRNLKSVSEKQEQMQKMLPYDSHDVEDTENNQNSSSLSLEANTLPLMFPEKKTGNQPQ